MGTKLQDELTSLANQKNNLPAWLFKSSFFDEVNADNTTAPISFIKTSKSEKCIFYGDKTSGQIDKFSQPKKSASLTFKLSFFDEANTDNTSIPEHNTRIASAVMHPQGNLM